MCHFVVSCCWGFLRGRGVWVGGRHFGSVPRRLAELLFVYFARLNKLLGVECSESASCRGAFGDLVFVIEDVGICLGRSLGTPAWNWGFGHRARVFG